MSALLPPWLRPDDTAVAGQEPERPMVVAPCAGFLCVVAGNPIEALFEFSPAASAAVIGALAFASGWLALA